MGYHPPRNVEALMPFDHVCVDLKEMPSSRRGNNYYLLLIDVCTRFVFLRELPSKSLYSIAQCLLRIFCDIGFPKILQSDNGAEFINSVLKALKQLAGIDERLISAYNHRSNGIAERSIQTTSHCVFKAVKGLISQWDDYLPAIQYAFNTRVVELHGSSPYALLFGRSPTSLKDYRDNEDKLETPENREKRLLFLNSIVFPAIFEKTKKTHEKRAEYFKKTHRMLKEDFPSGSQVMVRDELRTQKHQPVFEGPFTVLRRKESGNYELKGIDGTTYTRSPWVLKLVAPEIIKDLKVPDTIYAAVDHIVEHREAANGETQYRVRWLKSGPEMDSWLFEKDFVDYGPLQKYSKNLGKDLRTKKGQKNTLLQGNVRKVTKSVRFDVPSSGIKPINSEDTDRNTGESINGSIASNDSVEIQKIAEEPKIIELCLDEDQRDALGDYWKTTKGVKRGRKQSIVESDSD